MSLRLNNFIKSLILGLLLFTPLVYNPANSELFEIPKMYFVYLITLIIITAHLFNHIQYKAPLFRYHPLNKPILLFLLSQLLATIFSIDRHVSIFGYYSRLDGGLLSLLTFTSLFFTTSNYIDDKFRRQLINISLLSGITVAMFGIAQHFNITQYPLIKSILKNTLVYGLIDKNSWKTDVQARVFSTLGQTNWLAAYLCILLPFSLDRLLKSKGFILNTLYIILNTCFFLCLLFTKSKSGLIAAIISLGIYFVISFYKNNFSRKLLIINYSLLIVLSLTVSNPIKDFFIPKKVEIVNLELVNLNVTPSEDIRKIVWQGAVDLWKRYPIFGTGPETFAFSYYWTRPVAHNLTSEWQFLYNKAHNEYLNYLATSGTVGFLSYILLIVSISVYVLRFTDYNKKITIFCSFISILITNISGFSVVTISLFFFLLPLLAANFPVVIPNSYFLNPKSKLLLSFILVSSFLFLVSKTISFYIADIAYSKSLYFDKHEQYHQAYQFISVAHNLRRSEPTYLTFYSTIASKMAVSTKEEKYVTQATDSIRQATRISPYDTNLLKQRAQIYYYLSSLDKNYYLDTLNTLTHLTELAPTDPSNYFLLGRFYQNISETDRAVNNYQQAIQLKSNYDHATFALGEVYFQQKKYSEAKPLLETTLQIAPTNLQAKDYLARIATATATK